MAAKRRLPVLGPSGEEPQPPRPPWQWVGFGAAAVFVAWLPLAWCAALVVRGLVARALGGAADSPEQAAEALAAMASGDRVRLEVAIALTYLPVLALGALAGGYLVGRWGDAPVGVRHGAAAGALAALVAVVLAMTGGASAWSLLVLPLAAGGGALGARRGLRRRAP